jgi:hypothetical protein
MLYRVQLVPQPIVIDADGLPVPDSHVVEITFPGDAIETILGRVNTIVGPGTPKYWWAMPRSAVCRCADRACSVARICAAGAGRISRPTLESRGGGVS